MPELDVSLDVLSRPSSLLRKLLSMARVEQQLGDRGRVLLRPSGTEPVVRVMVEGEEATEVQSLCEGLAAEVERLLA